MIGIIAAMEIEVQAIVACMSDVEKKEISGIETYCGTVNEHEIVVVKSGIGIGNASMTTTILHEHFTLDKIVNIGTAGGLQKNQSILDVVISKSVVQYMYETGPENPCGLFFDADEDLFRTCQHVFKKMDIPAHYGVVATGDQFVYRKEQLDLIQTTFPEAMCVEMEAGAVAQVCKHYQTPFIVIRSLSDIAFQEKSELTFDEYAILAAERSAQFTTLLLQEEK